MLRGLSNHVCETPAGLNPVARLLKGSQATTRTPYLRIL
ncbi:hypothetical protein AGR1C_Cc10110 [Agrobacterium fabacearum TT111]|nr:hypothetical protein AGR1C_Cc10110 [Agrobacterium fabacearum TT111]